MKKEVELLSDTEVLRAYESGRRNFSHVRVEGADFGGSYLVGAYFYGAHLQDANFSRADLVHTQFKDADVTGASFVEARLLATDLIAGNFSGADLRRADLTGAAMNRTNLRNANLAGAHIGNARLDKTELHGAILDGISLSAHLCDTDIRPMCDASQIEHTGPSSVDARTVMKSYVHPELKRFLIDCGVPEIFAEYMIDCAKALGDDLLRSLMQSTFLSYGGPDEAFARRLYDALRAHGVVVFFFPESARLGERIGDEVFHGLQGHDRMILICSRQSLVRPGVLNEIQETLDREARDGGANYLLPVTLDDYVFSEWRTSQPLLAERVGRRVVGDFRNAERDPQEFERALGRLLDALKRKRPSLESVATPVLEDED